MTTFQTAGSPTVIVFSLHAPGALARVLRGEGPYTIITEEAGA